MREGEKGREGGEESKGWRGKRVRGEIGDKHFNH